MSEPLLDPWFKKIIKAAIKCTLGRKYVMYGAVKTLVSLFDEEVLLINFFKKTYHLPPLKSKKNQDTF